eukprot:m.196301 g.196301  ORF g.196301 m.196301 type:complete len:1257 (+) comp39530_c0_seq50:134-3904(+)
MHQPVYSSTVFACDTSSDGRFLRCDFPHCQLHSKQRKDHVWLLNTTQNVKIMEKHVGEEIEKYMTGQEVDHYPVVKRRQIGERNCDEAKIREITPSTKKVLVIFELDEPQASIGKWLEKFVAAACFERGLTDISVFSKLFRSRRELLRSVKETGDFLRSYQNDFEVLVILNCHSSSQGQVFSSTLSSITKKCKFEEFCSLHDFVCTCQDSFTGLLQGIHVSSCFTMKLDSSHTDWPVDAKWIQDRLSCTLSGSENEVYETGSQAADAYVALTSLLGNPATSSLQNLEEVVSDARRHAFPDLALEMGLKVMQLETLHEELKKEPREDKVHPRPLVSSDVSVAFLTLKDDLSSCSLADALCTALELRPDIKSDITTINVDFQLDDQPNPAKKARPDVKFLLRDLLTQLETSNKPVFLMVLSRCLCDMKSQVIEAVNCSSEKPPVYALHFANLPIQEDTPAIRECYGHFITGTTNGNSAPSSHASLFSVLLYILQLATGENGNRETPSVGHSAWSAREVFSEVSHVMEGLSKRCELRELKPEQKGQEEIQREIAGAQVGDPHLDKKINEQETKERPPDKSSEGVSGGSQYQTNDLPLSANVAEIVVEHFVLDLTVDFSSQILSGSIILFLRNLVSAEEKPAKPRRLRLDACDLVIERVEELDAKLSSRCGYEECCELMKKSGHTLDYQMAQWHMEVLPSSSCDDFPACIKIVYHTKPEGKSLAWANDFDGRPCVFNWGAPINNRAMFPGQDVPGGFSTWSAVVNVPKNCLLLMSGNFHQSLPSLGELDRHFYSMATPLPCSCVSFAAGYFHASPTIQAACQSDGCQSSIPCRLFTSESLLSSIMEEFHADLPKYTKAACDLLGPYPYKRVDVVILPRSFGCMGLASPNLVFLSPSVVSGNGSMGGRIGHEISHAWFGCLIGPKDCTEEWLTEGFATYCEDVIEAMAMDWPLDVWNDRFGLKGVIRWKALKGEIDNTDQNRQLLQKEAKQLEKKRNSQAQIGGAVTVKNALNPDKRFLQIHYLKGYFLLRFMALKVGYLEFNKVLKAYTTKFQSSLVTSQDFFTLFFDLFPQLKSSEFSPETLAANWLRSPTVPMHYSDVTSNNPLFNAVLEQIQFWREADKKFQCSSKKKKQQSKKSCEDATVLPFSDQVVILLEGLLELKKLTTSMLTQLDKCYKFSGQNADVRHRWCELVIKHLHRRALKDVRYFLTQEQGMGVYLYGELMCTEDSKAVSLARDVFDTVKGEMDYEARLIVSEMLYG